MRWSVCLGLVFALAGTAGARGEAIIQGVFHSTTTSATIGGVETTNSQDFLSVALPVSETVQVASNLGSGVNVSAVVDYSRTLTASGYAFRAAFQFQGFDSPDVGLFDGSEASIVGFEGFEVDAPTPYSITGLLNSLDADLGHIFIILEDPDGPLLKILFDANSPNGPEVYELGVNVPFTGALSGMLAPGKLYLFIYGIMQEDRVAGASPNTASFTASGFIQLTIGEPLTDGDATTVPEPAALALWLGAGAALALSSGRWRRRRGGCPARLRGR
jgi:hypothetical protein